MERQGYVVEAQVRFAAGADTRAPGGAVSVALCGHWEHDGPCRWPHHTEVEVSEGAGRVRTVYAVDPQEEAGIRARIEDALRGESAWVVDRFEPSELTADESALAHRVART
jgi:hypothetical protein